MRRIINRQGKTLRDSSPASEISSHDMTETNTSGCVLRSLLVALPRAVLSCLVALWVSSPSSQAPNLPRSGVDTDLLVHRLAEIRQQMEAGLLPARPHGLRHITLVSYLDDKAERSREVPELLDHRVGK